MEIPTIEIRGDESPTLDAFLGQKIYEFNSRTTGIFDGQMLNGEVHDEAGNIIGAVSGHTWGGCCEILWLWVHKSHRHHGLGRALLHAAEAEAVRRGCTKVLLSTHSFQAPAFYERQGYRKIGVVDDYPKGHQQIFYVKDL